MTRSQDLRELLARLGSQEYCYLTTAGRKTGRPHEIEIWFGAHSSTLYLLSGSEKSDWLKNLRQNPAVKVRIAEHTFSGMARLVSDPEEDRLARYRVAEKYQEWEDGKTLSQWAQTALPVAIDLEPHS